MEHQSDQALAAAHSPNLGTFSLGGKAANAADRGLHVVHGPVHVDARLQAHDDGSESLRGDRRHLVHAVKRRDLLLDSLYDGLFHLFRGRAGVRHENLDGLESEHRSPFLNQAAGGEESGRQHEQHQQVGGDAVSHHVADRSARVHGTSAAGLGGSARPAHGAGRRGRRSTTESRTGWPRSGTARAAGGSPPPRGPRWRSASGAVPIRRAP